MTFLLVVWLLQSNAVALENEYVRVTRDAAPCASSSAPGCGDRVIVALGEVELRFGASRRKMTRGDIAVFKLGESYEPPIGGPFFEVAIKANHPPVESPMRSFRQKRTPYATMASGSLSSRRVWPRDTRRGTATANAL